MKNLLIHFDRANQLCQAKLNIVQEVFTIPQVTEYGFPAQFNVFVGFFAEPRRNFMENNAECGVSQFKVAIQ